jgi:hypothetical protein
VTLNETSRVLVNEDDHIQFRISLAFGPALAEKGSEK